MSTDTTLKVEFDSPRLLTLKLLTLTKSDYDVLFFAR